MNFQILTFTLFLRAYSNNTFLVSISARCRDFRSSGQDRWDCVARRWQNNKRGQQTRQSTSPGHSRTHRDRSHKGRYTPYRCFLLLQCVLIYLQVLPNRQLINGVTHFYFKIFRSVFSKFTSRNVQIKLKCFADIHYSKYGPTWPLPHNIWQQNKNGRLLFSNSNNYAMQLIDDVASDDIEIKLCLKLKAGMNPGLWWILDGLYLNKYWSK